MELLKELLFQGLTLKIIWVDRARIQSFIPSVFPIPDTPEAANNKFNQLRGIIKEINGRFEQEGRSPTGTINRNDPTREQLLEFYSQ